MMERTERRSRSPDGSERRGRRHSSREYKSRRRSRSWSRSRSRDRDRNRSSRRYHSRSRSRDRTGGGGGVYNRGGSPDKYDDMLYDEDDYHHQHDNRTRYHNNHGNSDRYYEQRSGGGGGDRDDRQSNYRQSYRSNDRSHHRGGGGSDERRRSDYDGGSRFDRRRRDRSDDSFLDDLQSNYSFDGDQPSSDFYRHQAPNNKVIILGLAQHITETDISNDLIHLGLQAVSIRLIRKRKTGASRGFAFVEFDTQEEATRWMEFKQGVLVLNECRSVMQYSNNRDGNGRDRGGSDWYCVKCGVFNFKRRDNCYRCSASREESEKGGEGSDEVSTVLTKKILLRNLDVLTNEEGVLTHLQAVVPQLVGQIAKIQICKDPLTSTSRGVCYVMFDNLVDAMNMHNALHALPTKLNMEARDVLVTYGVDGSPDATQSTGHPHSDPSSAAASGVAAAAAAAAMCNAGGSTHRYTLADVPRLAEYSAGVYASNAAEHAHYRQYYTDYYVAEIAAGNLAGLPTMAQIVAAEHETGRHAMRPAPMVMLDANSGAAVALSAIQRKQQASGGGGGSAAGRGSQKGGRAEAEQQAAAAAATVPAVQVPTGRDNRVYPPPDVSQYQYDEQSTYYYDPNTGLYYDAHSQYYYNGDTGEYMYWNAERSTYTVAPASAGSGSGAKKAAAPAARLPDATHTGNDRPKNGSVNAPQQHQPQQQQQQQQPFANDDSNGADAAAKPKATGDKVIVAKKIVKDMERWAKQLNQKKDQMYQLPPSVVAASTAAASASSASSYHEPSRLPLATATASSSSSGGYADVGFSILENRDRSSSSSTTNAHVLSHAVKSQQPLFPPPPPRSCDSDSESELSAPNGAGAGGALDSEHVAYDKLTCLLCKRAFGSADVLTKHVQLSQLHKDNLRKLQQKHGSSASSSSAAAAAAAAAADDPNGQLYRDRAKERRQKYGEPEPPPVAVRTKQQQLQQQQLAQQQQLLAQQQQQRATSKKVAEQPIGQSNVGNRLLQKMGWQEGQGLGRANQGRTNIIETESRVATAGLGSKSTAILPGDDYKMYIKRMMKARYEQEE